MSEALHEIELSGCTPEPLMCYLKALGVLRLVFEQMDPNARAAWRGDVFVLRSTLDNDSLVSFFLEKYRPTPIVAPWAGGSGFFSKDSTKSVDALAASMEERLTPYREVIKVVRSILKQERVVDKPADEIKIQLLRRYRRELPEAMLGWMDAVMVLQEAGQAFAPLLGTGGNDGRFDFTQNFMGRLIAVGMPGGKPHPQSEHWLRCALMAVPAMLKTASVGQFAPGRSGGPNATQGMEGDATDNPWDFLLMLEGTLLLAGAAVK